LGCATEILTGEPCDDSDPCTDSDTCSAGGSCEGTSIPGCNQGKGKGVTKVSYNCLGVLEKVHQKASPFSYIADSIVVEAGNWSVFLGGEASADPGNSLYLPLQGAAASIDTDALSLQPFDICGSSAGSVLDSVVIRLDLADPNASGVADVEFRFNYEATLAFQNLRWSRGEFAAYTNTSLEVLGLTRDSFKEVRCPA
jgi:hypothetical protein